MIISVLTSTVSRHSQQDTITMQDDVDAQDAVDAVTMLSIRDILDHTRVAALIGVGWTVGPVASALLLFKLDLFA